MPGPTPPTPPGTPPPPPRFFRATSVARPVIVALLVVMALCAAGTLVVAVLVARRGLSPHLPPIHTSRVEVRPTPDVLVAVRDLARLETSSFHMERVVELTDQQTQLFGLIEARDAILLVAVGEVVAGVDLARLRPEDVRVEWDQRRATLRLPAPEVFSATLDNAQTHVYTRSTDRLAERREDLEGRARAEAERSMRQSAIDAGILARAQQSAEHEVQALVRAMGFRDVLIEWAQPESGEHAGLGARDR